MDFARFAEYIFYGLMSSVSIYIASTMRDMKSSIEALNITLARESEKLNNFKATVDRHETMIDRHSDRLMSLEQKTFNCGNNIKHA